METQIAIKFVKDTFQKELVEKLNLLRVTAPLFVLSSTGLNDNLSGKEKPVGFKVNDIDQEVEIVHSLAKWKRMALGKYGFKENTGLYTDMKAIRKDEEVDDIHSLYVEQWDWEKVIDKSDRTIDYLKDTVKAIYKSIRQTQVIMKQKYHFLTLKLPKTIHFITSQELEDLYPDKEPAEREQIIAKDKKAVFIIGIGDKLKSGIIHDKRSPDYDDWALDGDLLIYAKKLSKAIEISSMGIRVDEKALQYQLEKSKCMDRLELPYHQKIMKKDSRINM